MEIRVEGFVIRYSEAIHQFDLYKITVLQSGGRKGEEVERAEAYSTTLERCCKIIADYRIKNNLEAIDFDTYLKEYKEIINSVADKILEAAKLIRG